MKTGDIVRFTGIVPSSEGHLTQAIRDGGYLWRVLSVVKDTRLYPLCCRSLTNSEVTCSFALEEMELVGVSDERR